MTAMSKARAVSKARAMSKATSSRKFCELTDAKWRSGAEHSRTQGCARMRETRRFVGTILCVYTAVVIASTLWTGQDAVDQAWKRRVVQTIFSWQTCLLSFVSSGTSAFDSRILHRKGATCARGGVFKFIHVVNNDTITHAVHNWTVAFRTQS